MLAFQTGSTSLGFIAIILKFLTFLFIDEDPQVTFSVLQVTQQLANLLRWIAAVLAVRMFLAFW